MAGRKSWRRLVAVLAGTGPMIAFGPAAFAAATQDVAIQNFAFQPPAVTVVVGDTVRWANNDPTTHTATGVSGPAPFDTGLIPAGQSGSVVFTTPGTYGYFCQIHPGMEGSVNVQTVPDPTVPDAPLPVLFGVGMLIGCGVLVVRSSKLAA